MFPLIPYILIGVPIVLLPIILKKDKKAILIGPSPSGKTTFLRHISKDAILDGPTASPREYKVTDVDAVFDIVTDLCGDIQWIAGRFNEYIKDKDYVLFFFDASLFIDDTDYRMDCFTRVEMIDRVVKEPSQNGKSPIVLLVCTHIDKVSGNYEATVENLFAGKPYAGLLKRIAYVNTEEKECVKVIINKLKN